MATYLQGVTDYIPNVTFNPDYNFFQGALATKQGQYDQGWEQINSAYNSILNAPLTRGANQERRDEWLGNMESQLRKISNSDLSLPQNVDAARGVFKPFYEDDHMVYDITWTRHWNQEMQRSEALRTCMDDEKCGDKYWQGGVDLLNIERQEFANTTDEQSLKTGMSNYVDNFNMMKEAQKLAKEAGFEIIQEAPNGNWLVTQKNGSIAERPLSDFISAAMSTNQRAINFYKGKAKLLRVSDQESYAQIYGDITAAQEQQIAKVKNAQNLNNQAAKEAKGKVSSAKREIDYISNGGVKKITPKSILEAELEKLQQDLNIYEGSSARIQNTANSTNSAIENVGIEGVIQNPAMSDNIIASAMMNGDIMNSARAIANINTSQTLKANPFVVQAISHQNAMQRDAINNENSLLKEFIKGDMSVEDIALLTDNRDLLDKIKNIQADRDAIELEKLEKIPKLKTKTYDEPSIVDWLPDQEGYDKYVDKINSVINTVKDEHQKLSVSVSDKLTAEYNALYSDKEGSNFKGVAQTTTKIGDQLKKVAKDVLKNMSLTEMLKYGIEPGELKAFINDFPDSKTDILPASIPAKYNGKFFEKILEVGGKIGSTVSYANIGINGAPAEKLSRLFQLNVEKNKYASDYVENKIYNSVYTPETKIQLNKAEQVKKKAITEHKQITADYAVKSGNSDFIDENGNVKNFNNLANNMLVKGDYEKYFADGALIGFTGTSEANELLSEAENVFFGITPWKEGYTKPEAKKFIEEKLGITLSDDALNNLLTKSVLDIDRWARKMGTPYDTYVFDREALAGLANMHAKYSSYTEGLFEHYNSQDKVLDNSKFGDLGGTSGLAMGKYGVTTGAVTIGEDDVVRSQLREFVNDVSAFSVIDGNLLANTMNFESVPSVPEGSVYLVTSGGGGSTANEADINSLLGLLQNDYKTKNGIKPKSPIVTFDRREVDENVSEVTFHINNEAAEANKVASKYTMYINNSDLPKYGVSAGESSATLNSRALLDKKGDNYSLNSIRGEDYGKVTLTNVNGAQSSVEFTVPVYDPYKDAFVQETVESYNYSSVGETDYGNYELELLQEQDKFVAINYSKKNIFDYLKTSKNISTDDANYLYGGLTKKALISIIENPNNIPLVLSHPTAYSTPEAHQKALTLLNN